MPLSQPHGQSARWGDCLIAEHFFPQGSVGACSVGYPFVFAQAGR